MRVIPKDLHSKAHSLNITLGKSTQTSGSSQFNSWAKHLKFAEAFRIQDIFPSRFDVGAPGAFEIDVDKGNDITKPNTICIGVIEDPTLAKGDKVNHGSNSMILQL